VRSILRFGVAVALLQAGWGPAAMIVSVVVSEGAAVIVTTFQARFVPRFRFDRALAADMLKYGLAVFGSRLVGMLWLNGDYLVIGAKSTNREYGNYFTAFRLPELVLGSVYNIFSSVAFPTYSAAREAGPEKLQEAAIRSLRLLCMFGFPAGVGMALIARDFITVVFPENPGAILPMELLCLAGAFVGIGYASGDLFNAIGKPRLGLYFNLMGAPILIGGFLLVVDRGIAAVALVHLVVIVPYSLFRIEVANRLVGTTWRQSLAALRPGVVSVIGMLVLALPLRIALEPGFLSGVAIVVAGAIGVVLGLLIGDRSAFAEVRDLALKAVKKA
jgi:lipopolysaccharide exporter